MASKCEDHMDLGGFLQTYVLGNPFQSPNINVNASSKTTTQSPVGVTPKQKTQRKASSDQNDTNEQVSPILIVPSMQRLESRASGDDALQNEDPLIQLPDAPLPAPLSPSGDSGCSLGHVGSNAAYAVSLEKRKVADVHRPVQAWLLMNYQFCADVPAIMHCLYSNRLLLCEVQEQFANTSSIVLSRIVKFTFPQCSKIINKSGTFWQGLLKQPQVAHPAYITAAQALQHSNEWEDVMKFYHLTDPHDALTVTSLIYWRDSQGQRLDLDYLEQLYQEEFEQESDLLQSDKKHSPKNETKDATIKKIIRSDGIRPGRKTSPSRKCKQRSSLIEKFLKSQQNDSELSNEDANDEDYNPGSHPAAVSRTARKRKKSKPVKRTLAKACTGLDDEGLNVIGEVVATDGVDLTADSVSAPKRKRSARNRSESASPLRVSTRFVNSNTSGHCGHMTALQAKAGHENGVDSEDNSSIKQEPIDSSDEREKEDRSKVSNEAVENELLFGDKDENENCDFVEVGPQENGHIVPAVAEEKSCVYQKCLAENKKLKTSLKTVQFKLSFSHNKTKQLSAELSKSKEKVRDLRSQLSDKESQLFELARDFSDLSEKFKQFANKLQVAILQNSNNHSSSEAFNGS